MANQAGNIFYRWVAQVRSWWFRVCHKVITISGAPRTLRIRLSHLPNSPLNARTKDVCPFIDLNVQRTDRGNLETSIYRKPTPTNTSISTLAVLFALESCEGGFSQCLVYFLRRYITSHCLIKFSLSYALVQEDVQYDIEGSVGSGYWGNCYKATTTSDSFSFCIKTVSRPNDVLQGVKLLN